MKLRVQQLSLMRRLAGIWRVWVAPPLQLCDCTTCEFFFWWTPCMKLSLAEVPQCWHGQFLGLSTAASDFTFTASYTFFSRPLSIQGLWPYHTLPMILSSAMPSHLVHVNAQLWCQLRMEPNPHGPWLWSVEKQKQYLLKGSNPFSLDLLTWLQVYRIGFIIN